MSRLSLDAFKAQSDSNQAQELESLTGGQLAECHCSWVPPPEGANSSWGWQQTLSYWAHIAGAGDCEVH